MNLNSPPDEYDRDGANITASRLLNDHHQMVPESGFGDGVADNCKVCGFAAGFLQVPGEDSAGHATATSSETVRHWIEHLAVVVVTCQRCGTERRTRGTDDRRYTFPPNFATDDAFLECRTTRHQWR